MIVHKLECKDYFTPTFLFLRGLYLVKHSKKLKDFEKAHYKMVLHDYLREYYKHKDI